MNVDILYMITKHEKYADQIKGSEKKKQDLQIFFDKLKNESNKSGGELDNKFNGNHSQAWMKPFPRICSFKLCCV